MPRDSSFDDDEFVELNANDISDESEQAQGTYFSMFTSAVAGVVKQGLVYTAYAVGGSFVAVAVTPRVLPYVVSYVVPSAGAPGLIASTTTAALGVMSFKFGSQISTMSTEAALNLTGFALKGAASMLFSGDAKNMPKTDKAKTSSKKNFVARKTKNDDRANQPATLSVA